MNPILIVGGLVVIYLLLENQMKGLSGLLGPTSTGTAPVVSTGIRVLPFSTGGGGPSGVQIAQSATQAGLSAAQDWASSASQEGSALAGAVGQAVPIIGAAIAPIFSLLAAHTARVKGAQTENQALNQVFPAMQADIQSVLQAYSARQITEAQGETALQQILENYWAAVGPFEHGPGQAGGPMLCAQVSPPQVVNAAGFGSNNKVPYGVAAAGSTMYYTSPCDKTCTVSCCAGCNTAQNWIATALNALRVNRNATLTFRGQTGSSYGWTGTPKWNYTFIAQ